MKRILLTMTALLMSIASAMADDVTVGNIAIPQGSSATLSISLTNTNSYRQLFQLKLILPEGVTMREGSGKLSNRFGTTASLGCNEVSTRTYQFICQAGTDITPITGNSGELFTVVLDAAPSLTAGTELQGSITDIEVTTSEATAWNPEDKTFNISIAPPLAKVVLSETSVTAPTASDGAVDVTVNRTIKANEWSTICLPFDMTAQQVTTAFGAGVQLKKLSSWSFEGTPTAADKITLNFTSITTITKNVPCLIKVTSAVSSFDVDGVVIDPVGSPGSAAVTYTKGEGWEAVDYTARLYGFYTATTVPNKALFLADNQLWYSVGSTNIKAFRGVFWLGSVVLAAYSTGSSARVMLNFDDATGISDAAPLTNSDEVNSKLFSLSGQRVDTPKKGIYVKGGKKVIIK